MIHPHSELRFISDEVGYGVFATRPIPKGTITWVLDELDREFTPEEIAELSAPYQEILEKYCYRNSKGNSILCWDLGRFVNHSFDSNCLATAYGFEIAVRDIEPGEELTDDYGYLNITEPFRGIEEGTRRKIVYPDDLVRYHKVWDKQVQSAIKHTLGVDQPLKQIIEPGLWKTITRLAEGKEPMRSIYEIYYDPAKNGSQRNGVMAKAAQG